MPYFDELKQVWKPNEGAVDGAMEWICAACVHKVGDFKDFFCPVYNITDPYVYACKFYEQKKLTMSDAIKRFQNAYIDAYEKMQQEKLPSGGGLNDEGL